MQGPAQLIELGFQASEALFDHDTLLSELRQKRFNFCFGKRRVQRADTSTKPRPLQRLPGIARHTTAQFHDVGIVVGFANRVLQQNRFKQVVAQWIAPNRFLQPGCVMNFKAQRYALRVGQSMQNGGIKTVFAMQVLIEFIPGLEKPAFSMDQYFANRGILRPDTVEQGALNGIVADFQAQILGPTRQGFQ
ncbi:hypothetical protein D3C76_1215970 [compost metagenome]